MSSSYEDDIDDPSTQLQHNLRSSITKSLSTRRPLLTHLNADTTWLLSLPYPPSSSLIKHRVYYHILIDPWLRGGQSDVAKFFSQQWHAVESAVQTITGVEEYIKGIEDVARRGDNKFGGAEEVVVLDPDREHDGTAGEKMIEQGKERWIDAVVISHEFTDHMHMPTLLEVPPSVPVLATPKAHSTIKSWKHFHTVRKIGRFGGDWREGGDGEGVLPKWVRVSRVAYAGNDLLYYHSAIMVAFQSPSVDSETCEDGEAEAVIYTPHGISPSDIEPVSNADPKVRTLALLHGLQDITLGAQLNMGAHNGLKVQRLLGAKYWIGTHDEVKKGGGIVSWFLDRKMISLKDAIEKERNERGGSLKGSGLEGLGEVRFKEVGNGESLVLE